jgi:hypothetical protein
MKKNLLNKAQRVSKEAEFYDDLKMCRDLLRQEIPKDFFS